MPPCPGTGSKSVSRRNSSRDRDSVQGLRGAWWLLPIALSLLAVLRPLFGPGSADAGFWLIVRRSVRARGHRRAGICDRPQRLEHGRARRGVRRAGTEPARDGTGSRPDRDRAADPALPRARREGLVPRRRLRGLVDRDGGRPDRDVRVLSRRDHPGERGPGQPRRVRSRRVRRQVPRPLDLGARLPRLRPAVRGRLEHAVPRASRRRRDDGSRPRLRAHRDPHRVPAEEGAPGPRASFRSSRRRS